MVNIIVCVRVTPDVAQIRLDSTTKKPIIEGVPKVISEVDKNAVEEAVRIKEKLGGKVTVLTVATEDVKGIVKEALAMGADTANIIADPTVAGIDGNGYAKILASAIKKIGEYDLILLGYSSQDIFSAQIAPRLGVLLDLPVITGALELSVESDKIVAKKDLEREIATLEASLPAVVSVDRTINEPRIPTIMQVMQATRKPITIWKLSDVVSEEIAKAISIIENKGPDVSRKRIIFKDEPEEAAKKLIEALQKEGVLEG